MMDSLSKEKKVLLKSLYKAGEKIVKLESHLEFLSQSLHLNFIPKRFQVKNNLPGNFEVNEQRLKTVSIQSIKDEKLNHENSLKAANASFEVSKSKFKSVFGAATVKEELERLFKHLDRVKRELKHKKRNKVIRDTSVTLVSDDDAQISAHTNGDSTNITLVSDDDAQISTHVDPNTTSLILACDDHAQISAHNNSAGVTLVSDDDTQVIAHKKKKRRFKRKYLQPQPKRKRRRRRHKTSTNVVACDDIADNVKWNDIVKNISNVPVTATEAQLLGKGKKFCPVELDPPIIRMQSELNRFYRMLRISWQFDGQEDTRSNLEKEFYHKSTWEPPKACKEIENFIDKIQDNFDKWTPPKYIKDNLTKKERSILKNIQTENDIVYKWEDKGPSFTKMQKDQYLIAGEKELDNELVYKKFDVDLSNEVKEKCDAMVNGMLIRKEIPEKVALYLLSGEKNLCNFYHLLKTHKIPSEVENPQEWLDLNGHPLRGIISGRGGPTERLASFVNYFLQPGMKDLPSFLQDTKHTLQIIEEINQSIESGELSLEGVALVSLDVESMYNNMSEELAGGATREFLNESRKGDEESLRVQSSSILEALDICLKNSFFSFNDQIYQQIGGVGTGYIFAPPYTCLGMGKFEKEVFSQNKSLLERIKLWKRFIDDILMLFKGTQSECESLVNWLNSLQPGVIKFKYQYSTEVIEFLDLKIYLEGGRLKTNLFIKPSNQQLYLDYFSNHPQPCKEGIVYGQALRILERCSEGEWAETHLENLREKLIERNYPDSLIQEKFVKAKQRSRHELIHQHRRGGKRDNKVRLIFTHNGGNPPLHQWLRNAKKCLVKNERAKAIGQNIQICFSQPKNLQRLVTQKKPPKPQVENPGCWKCSSKKCTVACPVLKEGTKFSSTNTGRTYTIRQSLDCNSSFIIYLATCKKCGGQYVGKSETPFKKRHSNHRQEIKKEIGGLGQHYGGRRGCQYENVSIQLIEQVQEGDSQALENREVFWQNQLRCYIQNGGHAHCRRKEKARN